MAGKVIKAKTRKHNTVTFSVIGGDTYELELNNGPTLGELLKEALPKKFDRGSAEVRVNNARQADDYRVQDGDIISVVPRVAGGRA